LTDNLPLVFKLHEICSVDFLKNHKNCCHQMSDFKAKMHQIRFRLGLTTLLQTSYLHLRGLLLREGKGEGMRVEGREEKGGERRPFW